jgi:hypothetical protein
VNLEALIMAAAAEGEEPTVDQKLAKLEKLLAEDKEAREKEKQDLLAKQAEAQKAAEQKFIDDYKKKIESWMLRRILLISSWMPVNSSAIPIP